MVFDIVVSNTLFTIITVTVQKKVGSPFCFGVKNSQTLENTGLEGNFDVNGVEMTKEVAKA